MRGIKTLLMIPVATMLLVAGGCTSNGYDDGGSADVVLEIISSTTPPVTAATSTNGFCSVTTGLACTDIADCPVGEGCIIGGCTLTVVDWTFSMANVPKNSQAAPPANDIAMIDVTVSYGFPAGNPAPRTFGLGGVVIPTGGGTSLTFPPIALQDLNAALEATTGSVILNFRGQTLEGTALSLVVGEDLTVEQCI